MRPPTRSRRAPSRGGNLTGNTLVLSGNASANTVSAATFAGGNLTGNTLVLSGNATANTFTAGTFAGGNLTGNSLVLSGNATANTVSAATFAGGNLTGNTLVLSGNATVNTVSAGTFAGGNLTGNTLILSGNATANTVTAGTLAGGNLTGNTLVLSGNVTANVVGSTYTAAQSGANASSVTSLSLPLVGDHSQAWCKVSSNSIFSASLMAGADSNSANYIAGLTSTVGNTAGVSTVPLSVYSNGVVIMANCAPSTSHAISVRALNPAGVFDIDASGNSGNGVYRNTGAILYSGATPNALQITFSPAVTVAKYGVQQVLYN